jgi:two-component system cell cycle sensor histidine kinase/response regulator CckA
MVIIILESICIAVILFIFRYLWLAGSRERVCQEPGWSYIVWGFGLILFGAVIDITANFPTLNRFVVVGDTSYQALLEKGVGYLPGLVLLALGFLKWVPTIAAGREAGGVLQEPNEELETQAKERTADPEDRKGVLRVLRETEERFQQLAENVQDVFYINDHTKAKLIYVSPAYEKIWGRPRETLYGDPLSFMETIAPEDRATVLDAMEEQRQGKPSVVQYRILRPDGARRWMLSRSYPVFDGGGRHHRTVGIAADITERKEAEEALRESEEKYRQLFEMESDALFLIDNEAGGILEVNAAAQALYGYSRDELLSMKNTDLSAEPEATRDATVSHRRQIPLRYHRRKDGTVIPVEITARHFELGGRAVHVAAIRDISFRVGAEEQKRKLEAELLHAQKMEAVGTLAGGIAHDFNNLLQAVQGYAELLLIKTNASDAGAVELKEIVRAAQKGAELTRQMLTFSRKVESNKRPLDLNHELQQVKGLLERTLPKMIEIELILADNLRLVNADRVQMQQVVMNLAVNAKDAMPEGGRLIIRTENVFLDETYCRTNPGVTPGQYVALTVSDTGHGMDDHTLKHLFEPFFTTKETGRGSGLGLSMVYGIVKSHDGHITCRSKVGAGATFTIYLPMLEHGAETQDSKDVEESLRGGTETVLLVDDDQLVLDFAKRIIEQVGYTALTAADGEMAVATYVLHKQRIDLVILDVIMPGMGGKKSLEKILQINPHARVLLMTGYSSDAGFEALLAKGAKGLLKKPFKAKDLLNTIRKVLDQT